MALKGRMSRTILIANFLALDISLLFYLGVPTTTGTIVSRRPNHSDSVETTDVASPEILRNVYVEDAFVLPVVQQPSGKPNYVSSNNDEVTQFSAASKYGNIGLLAHNYLSGKSFSRLTIGQNIQVEYRDGRLERFIVKQILRYQALDPHSPYSSFQNMDNAAEILSTGQMFERAYAGEYHLTFQTCIKAYGNSSWGRLFIVAAPQPEYGTLGALFLP